MGINKKNIKLEFRRKLAQAFSVCLIAFFIFFFSPEGVMYFGEPWRIYWTMGFVLGKYLVFQLMKFGYPKRWHRIEKKYMRRDGHKHTWKCLMEPEIAVLIFLPFINPIVICMGVFFVLIDVYACMIGVAFGRYYFFQNKSVIGSLGALFCIFFTLIWIIPVPLEILFLICLIAVGIEVLSPFLLLKDNFYLALYGIIVLIVIFKLYESYPIHIQI